MSSARLMVKPPGGPVELSTTYPDDEYRFLANRFTNDGVLTFFEAETSNPEAILRFIDEHPEISEISSYEMLHNDENGIVIEFMVPDHPPPVRAALDT